MQRTECERPTRTTGRRRKPSARISVLLASLTVVALSCAPESLSPIAVQGAVDSEIGPLIAALGNPEPTVIQGFSFWKGQIANRPVVVSRTEVGMTHGAMATMILIDEFAPSLIINQGTAGAVNPQLAVGDIVLGRASAPFGAVKTAHRDPGAGVDLGGWVTNPRKIRTGHERIPFEHFDSDPDLLATALAVPYRGGRLVEGIVGSGDQWNREIDKLLWAHELWGIDSEDMESAAVAQVAHIYGVPFLPVRIISNSEHNDPVFREETGAECAEYVVALVEKLAAGGA